MRPSRTSRSSFCGSVPSFNSSPPELFLACLPACLPAYLSAYGLPPHRYAQSYECVTAVTQRLEKMGIAGHQTTAGAERKVDRASSLMAALTRKVGREAAEQTSRLARDRLRQADSPAYVLLERVRCLRWRSVGWQGSTETKKAFLHTCVRLLFFYDTVVHLRGGGLGCFNQWRDWSCHDGGASRTENKGGVELT